MVGIIIMIVIVLLISKGSNNSLEWMCAGGGSTNSVEWISCRCFLHGYSYSLLYSRVHCYLRSRVEIPDETWITVRLGSTNIFFL